MPDIRKVTKQDLQALQSVIETNELFPVELLEKMMDDFFTNPSTEDIWLTKEINNTPIAVLYCAPERMTDITYNLYLIAVHKDFQGNGVGTELMIYVEQLLQTNGKRILLVETSGLPAFELTRKFYKKCNYTHEATIRDFYREHEDKIVFWKNLAVI